MKVLAVKISCQTREKSYSVYFIAMKEFGPSLILSSALEFLWFWKPKERLDPDTLLLNPHYVLLVKIRWFVWLVTISVTSRNVEIWPLVPNRTNARFEIFDDSNYPCPVVSVVFKLPIILHDEWCSGWLFSSGPEIQLFYHLMSSHCDLT